MSDLDWMIAASQVLGQFFKGRYDELRAEAETNMNPGDRRVVLSPLDGKTPIAEVYRSKPRDVAVVDDLEAFTTWMRANYRGMTETSYEVIGTDEQVLRVLFEHAPHLLKAKHKVKQKARLDILDQATKNGFPMGPGGEADMPGVGFTKNSQPYVACKPDKDAALAMFQLYAQGRIGLDGALLPAIEAPKDMIVDGS